MVLKQETILRHICWHLSRGDDSGIWKSSRKYYLRRKITDIDISLEERLELEKKEQLLLDESKGIYPEWNEMTDINLMEAMFSLQEEERKLIYQHVFEERTFKEMSILNQMPEERCKGAYYWAIRKIRKRMGGKRS